MKKIAFVVQRYGKEVNGGAETHCRELAERLRDMYQVDVLTTCAVDYYSWKNEYKKGTGKLNGVTVRRFKVDKKRNVKKFNELWLYASQDLGNLELGREWMEAQGPYSTKLFDYIRTHQNEYDVIIFFTYLYASTYFGTEHIQDKSKIVLIPTAHDEPPIYLGIFDTMFSQLGGFIFNTEEERDFLYKRFSQSKIEETPAIIAGVGAQLPEGLTLNGNTFKEKYGLEDYVVYIGRIDEPKGCKDMFRMFEAYKETYNSDVKLVLMGKEKIKIPDRDDVISLGFVSEEDKYNGILGAQCMLIPSEFESLSMVLLESFLCSIPVLVNGSSEVLKGHCLRSNGGLWYDSDTEFVEGLHVLLKDKEMRKKLGENGHAYVRENYSWPQILKKIDTFLTNVK